MPRLYTPQPRPSLDELKYYGSPVGAAGIGLPELTSASVAITASSSAYAAYSVLTAGLPYDALLYGLTLSISVGSTGTKTWVQARLGVGSSGNERVVLEWKLGGPISQTTQQYHGSLAQLPFPLFIPAGTALSWSPAGTSSGGSPVARIAFSTVPFSPELYYRFPYVVDTRTLGVVSYQPALNRAVGVSVTPGNTVYGSWAAITTGLASEVFLVGPAFTSDQGGSASIVQAGIGATGAEIPVGAITRITLGNSGGTPGTDTFPLPVRVPSGTQISLRSSADDATPSASTMDIHYIPANLVIPITSL